MVKVAMTGDLVRARYVRLAGNPLGLQVGVNQPCCNECPPCCECNGIEVAEECGELQQIIASFTFVDLGNCFNGGGGFTATLTAEDQDNGFPFSKNITFPVDNGEVVLNVAFFCDVAACYVLTGSIAGSGCTFCNGGAPFFDVRLNGTDTEEGICCPSGRTVTLQLCDDVEVTIAITLVY